MEQLPGVIAAVRLLSGQLLDERFVTLDRRVGPGGLVALGFQAVFEPLDARQMSDSIGDECGRRQCHHGKCDAEQTRGAVAANLAPELGQRSFGASQDRFTGEKSLKILGQRQGGRIALAAIFLQTLQADRLQITRHARLQLARRNRFLLANQVERVQRRRAAERRTAGDHLVQNGAERVNVGRRRDVLNAAKRLLRGHVGRRAHDVAGERQGLVLVKLLGQPEVGDLRAPLRGQ